MPYKTDIPSNHYAYLDGPPKPTYGRNTFDSATASVLFRGTRDQFDLAFPLGGANSGISSTLFLSTATIVENRFGHLWADLQWRGFYEEKSLVFAYSATTRETEFPRTIQTLNGPYISFIPGSYIGKTGNTNGTTGKYWQVRVHDQISAVTVRGYSRNPILLPPPPPAVGGTSAELATIAGVLIKPVIKSLTFTIPDPVFNYPSGWILQNYDFEEIIELGYGTSAEALYLWKAEYLWKPESGP